VTDIVERLKFHGRYASESNADMAIRKHGEREEAVAEIQRLRAALLPFAEYAGKRMRMPLNGLGDAVHCMHGGTEWEAEITFTHCKNALVAIRARTP